MEAPADQAAIQLETLSPVASHALFCLGFYGWNVTQKNITLKITGMTVPSHRLVKERYSAFPVAGS
jgi:hypothetical protein